VAGSRSVRSHEDIKGDFYLIGDDVVLARNKKKVSGFSLN
jgi:hypothetical protein